MKRRRSSSCRLSYFVQFSSATTKVPLTIGFMTIRLRGMPALKALVRNCAVSIAFNAPVTCGRSALNRLTKPEFVKLACA